MENKVFEGFSAGEYDVPLVDGVRNGKGTQKYTKGDLEYTLECTWVNGKKSGEGVLLDSNYIIAMKFNFVEDVIEGEGYLYDNGQTTFKGMWKGGMRYGLGQEFEKGRLVFKGEYADDKRNGFGILYDENQEVVFEGKWVNGERGLISIEENDNGDREMIEKNESGMIQYIGGFKEGTLLREGKGVEYNEEGQPCKESFYKDGLEERKIKEFKGNSITIFDSQGKKMYEGEYLQDSAHRYPPHGKGRLFEGNVMVYFGDFVKGKREGHGCSYHLTRCLKYEGDWMNDMANGMGKYHNDEGHMIVDGEFHDNVYEDDKIRIYVDLGKVEEVKKGGCACFGSSRRSKTKQLPSMYEDETASNANMIKSMKEFTALPNNTSIIRIASDSLNEESTVDFSRFTSLRRLIIGDNALTHIKQFNLREMKFLKYLEIGNKSCSLPELANMDKKYTVISNDHSMFIESCPALEEIVLGDGACADYVRFSLIGRWCS